MYRTILVPLDGSPAAEHALPWALSIARQDGAAIRLARVHLPATPILVGNELVADFSIDQALREQERKYLEDVIQRVKPFSTGEVKAEIIEGGVVDALLEQAQTITADLIVMTTHGRGPLARFWLGSIADKFVRHTRTPTLLVRPTEAAADFTTTPFIRNILIPMDGSKVAEQILEPAMRLGRLEGADYTLLMVLDAIEDIAGLAGERAFEIPSPWKAEFVHARGEAYLREIADRFRARSMRVHIKMIQHGSAAETILDFAKNHGNPVIALATRGHGGLQRLMFGSVADKVIRGATMPVLVFHPTESD